jgi:hypothetical protein
MNNKSLVIIIILFISIAVNAELNRDSRTLNISYGFSGSIYADEYSSTAEIINELSLMYNYKIIFAGVVFSYENSLPQYISDNEYYFGTGMKMGIGCNDTSKIDPFVSLKYIYSGHINKTKILNEKEIENIDIILQRLSLEFGTKIKILKFLGIGLSYNLNLYKSGCKFSDQFENLLGIMLHLNFTIRMK